MFEHDIFLALSNITLVECLSVTPLIIKAGSLLASSRLACKSLPEDHTSLFLPAVSGREKSFIRMDLVRSNGEKGEQTNNQAERF